MGAPAASDEQLRSFIGPPLFESFIRVGMFNEEDAKKAVELYRERFNVVGWKENSVYPGIPAILKALKKRGAYVAVATAKPIKFSERIIEYFGLAPYIDRLEAISMTEHHADKGVIVRRALPEKYTRACMIGDRATDIIGAIENNIDGIGALYGYGSREELTGAGAFAIADTVEDLWPLLFDEGEEKDEGLFITFEGSDGCGKSTQARLAASGWPNAATTS
jgi:phosphoglycolate phosphatase